MKTSAILLIATLTVCAPALPLFAQSNGEEATEKAFYRVEAIVFTHASGQSDDWPITAPADHTDAIDPAWRAFARDGRLERAGEEASASDSELATALNIVDTLAQLERGDRDLGSALLYPEPWLALDEFSETMQQARDRLERSGAYRVRAALAWHQGLDRAAQRQAVRIHDDQILKAEWIELAPTGRPLRNGRPVRNVSELVPAFHYRLDGSIRLRQRQFMHADIELHWRAGERVGPAAWPLPGLDADYAVHRLAQSRTIRAERIEYFDSDWLGLLLRVTRHELDPESDVADTDDPAREDFDPNTPSP
ncbi:CsiV family protein [Wenzhouxiangella sp. EGI_FJ10409]|uniref:CsiV family protein n=1 Tax=Wenzhouxiangella sp. EGI_FJ10409 TaxID=3243767 RepID=UPI0035DFF26B